MVTSLFLSFISYYNPLLLRIQIIPSCRNSSFRTASKDLGIVLAIGLVSLQVILLIGSIIIGGRPVFLPGHIYLILVAIFAGLSLLAVLVLRHYTMRYAISSSEISFAMGQRERKINRVLGLLALLSGKPQAIGLAMTTGAGEMGSIPWHEVYRVTVHRGLRVITLSNSWRPVVRLYCPREGFEEIAARVEAYAAEGAAWRTSRNVGGPRAGFVLKWAGLVTLAMIAGLVWSRERSGFSDIWGLEFDWASNEVPPLVLIVATLVLLAGALEGWLRRGVALLATLGSVYLVYKVVSLGITTFTGTKGLTFHGYQVEPLAFAISLVGMLTLLAMSGVRLLGYPRDRRWPSQKAKINQ